MEAGAIQEERGQRGERGRQGAHTPSCRSCYFAGSIQSAPCFPGGMVSWASQRGGQSSCPTPSPAPWGPAGTRNAEALPSEPFT